MLTRPVVQVVHAPPGPQGMVPEDGLVPQHTISKACATLEDQAPSRQRTSHERPSPLLCTTPQQSVASEQCIASEQCSSLSQAKQLTTSQQPIAVEQCPTADPDAATEHKTHPEEHASESDLGFDSDSDPPPGPSQRTRFHESSQSTRKRIEQTLHLAIVVGKDQDPVVSAEWLQEVGEDMLQSDAAVGKYIALKHPHIKVTILKPRLGDITKLAEKLQGVLSWESTGGWGGGGQAATTGRFTCVRYHQGACRQG